MSFLLYFLIVFFPASSPALLSLSFCLGLIYLYLLWNRYPNYLLPLYFLFVFLHMFEYRFGEVTFLVLLMVIFYTVLFKLFNYLNIPKNYFLIKKSYIQLLLLIILVLGTVFDISFYYLTLIFMVIFVKNEMFSSLLILVFILKLKDKAIINSIDRFENLYKIKTIIFNKTGVMTLGDLCILNTVTTKPKLFWKYLSYAEVNRDDRIAEVIKCSPEFKCFNSKKCSNYCNYDNGTSFTFSKKTILVGNRNFLMDRGINILEEETAGTYIYVVQNDNIIGYLVLTDKIDLNNKKVIDKLRRLGVDHFVLFSNDQDKLTTTVARTLGIKNSYGGLNYDKRRFWLYYLKEQYSDEIAFISDDEINDDVKVKINLSYTINDNSKSDIIIIDHKLSSCLDLFRFSKILHLYELSLFKMMLLGQVLIIILGLILFTKIWMIVLFTFIWVLFWIIYYILKIIKLREE